MPPAVEIVTIHTNPKRKRDNDLETSLTLRVSVDLNHGRYQSATLHFVPGGLQTARPCSMLISQVVVPVLNLAGGLETTCNAY